MGWSKEFQRPATLREKKLLYLSHIQISPALGNVQFAFKSFTNSLHICSFVNRVHILLISSAGLSISPFCAPSELNNDYSHLLG